MRRVVIYIVLLLAMLAIWQEQALAIGCIVIDYEWTDPETGQTITLSYDHCSDGWTECESGTYMAPDGSCHDIGEEECFPAGTQISMADGSKKNIEEVQVGDRVMNQSEGGVRGGSTVTNLDRRQPLATYPSRIRLFVPALIRGRLSPVILRKPVYVFV